MSAVYEGQGVLALVIGGIPEAGRSMRGQVEARGNPGGGPNQ